MKRLNPVTQARVKRVDRIIAFLEQTLRQYEQKLPSDCIGLCTADNEDGYRPIFDGSVMTDCHAYTKKEAIYQAWHNGESVFSDNEVSEHFDRQDKIFAKIEHLKKLKARYCHINA